MGILKGRPGRVFGYAGLRLLGSRCFFTVLRDLGHRITWATFLSAVRFTRIGSTSRQVRLPVYHGQTTRQLGGMAVG